MMDKLIAPAICVLLIASTSSFAAKPNRESAATIAAPEVFSVKVNYTNAVILVEGTNLSPNTVSVSMSGVALNADATSTDNSLILPFTPELSAVVDELGNYVLKLSTDGGTVSVGTFIPFALVSSGPPPPPGKDCPCSPEWDQAGSSAPPSGFYGLMPYCSEDSGNFVTVQYYDNASLYWVLWTEWFPSTSAGYCELWIDGPNRALTSQVQFDACAGYLQNIVTVFGDQENVCLF